MHSNESCQSSIVSPDKRGRHVPGNKNILKAPTMPSVIFLTKYQNIPVIIHLVTGSIFT